MSLGRPRRLFPRWRTAQSGGVSGVPSPQLVCDGPVYCCHPTRPCRPPSHSRSTGHSPFDDPARQPAPSCLHLDMDVAQVTGRQLDARKQNRRDMSKRAPSPAAQLHPKKARTPSTEEEDETDQMVRLSKEEVQKRERARARSASRNPRRRRAKSAAQATGAKESFIPAGYENTRREELQRKSRRNKARLPRWVRPRRRRSWSRAWRRRSSMTRRPTFGALPADWRARRCRQPTHGYAACGSSKAVPWPTPPTS